MTVEVRAEEMAEAGRAMAEGLAAAAAAAASVLHAPAALDSGSRGAEVVPVPEEAVVAEGGLEQAVAAAAAEAMATAAVAMATEMAMQPAELQRVPEGLPAGWRSTVVLEPVPCTQWW